MTAITLDSTQKAPSAAFSKLNVGSVEKGNAPKKQGDTLTVSEAAKIMEAADKEKESGGLNIFVERNEDNQVINSQEDRKQQRIRQIKERIKQLQEEIKKLEESDLPEKEKTTQVQAKQTELMELTSELQKLLSGKKAGPIGGTPANDPAPPRSGVKGCLMV